MMNNSREFDEQANEHRRFLSKRDFKELFRYEENDRDKKAIKKDWKKLDKHHRD